MFNFDFYNPTHIVFGKDRLGTLDQLVPKDAVVLITFGGGSAQKSGLLAKVKTHLGNRKVFEFGGIEPNPKFETLVKAVDLVKEKGVTFLLPVGGGSVIDGTKFIALAARTKVKPEQLLTYGFAGVPLSVASDVLPIGVVLTLPATGSEMNNGAVISRGHDKLPVMSGLTFPKFSLLDPTITYTLPAVQVANGIVDAFVHTTEQYLTFPVDARIQDRTAEGILLTLVEIGRKSIDEPENYDVRANHVWAATMALNGLIGAGVPQDWATHMIGHELTALFGIDHGQTLAIVLPALLEARKAQKREKLIQYAQRVWGITNGSDDEKVRQAIQKTRDFFESLGVKTHLSAYGVGAERVAEVVAQLKAHGMVALGEKQDLRPEEVEKLLLSAV